MHAYDLILTITGSFTAALILGYGTQRLDLSPNFGDLLAGTLVGPHTPGFVADASMAGIGVILMMVAGRWGRVLVTQSLLNGSVAIQGWAVVSLRHDSAKAPAAAGR